MRIVLLIRHAAPAVHGVFLGSKDVPLASESFSPSPLEPASIFASPLQRARRTAELLFPARQITVVPDLAEYGVGDWEGMAWEEIMSRSPELASRKVNDWSGVTPPNGEPWQDFVARVQRAWVFIRRSPVPIAVVAHCGVNSVLAHLIGAHDPLTFHQNYCEVLTLEFDE